MDIHRWEDEGGAVVNPYDLAEAPKRERLQEFIRLLDAAEPVSSYHEAKQLLDDTLNAVEDRTGIPYNPDNWLTDGRIYPVSEDNTRPHPDYPEVMRLISTNYAIYIRSNGAIEIVIKDAGVIKFQKPGADGRGVWD